MARSRRLIESNLVHHIYNRRTDKQCLFPDADAYQDLLEVIRRGNARCGARLHAYCFLHTHIHLAVSAESSLALSDYVHWISTTHAVRFRLKTETRGNGHVYQDRYKSRPVEDAVHYATLIRYIERNPLEAGVVTRAEEWEWSSLGERISGTQGLIQPGPWTLPDGWLDLVNEPKVAMHEIPSLLGQMSSFRPRATAFPEFN